VTATGKMHLCPTIAVIFASVLGGLVGLVFTRSEKEAGVAYSHTTLAMAPTTMITAIATKRKRIRRGPETYST